VSVTDEILGRSARALAKGIREGELSAVEVTRVYLEQIDATAAQLHAFRCVTPDLALAQAEAVDRARVAGHVLGPLAGVPVALKDIFVTQGVPTTCGSAILDGWIPPYQGTHARRLADAGAVLLGKLAMDEFGMGSANENTPFEPVHNPWALDHVPGGSSGGTAAAVAARCCALGLGSDTGGSIRQPASLCNLVGLKPTYGRVSRHGMIAFASSLDQAGPMTREVGDAALALGVLAGVDPLDSTSLDAPVPDYLAAVDAGALGQLGGVTIGLHRRALELDGLDPEVRERFEASLAVLASAGARVIDIELPHFEHAVATYYVLCTAEASSNLARYDGVRYGLRRARPDLRETYEATRHDGFGTEVKRRILLGTFVLRAESYADYYGRAMKVRTLISQDYAAAFERCDVIASPTSPVPSWRIGTKVDDPLALYLLDVFTIGANLAGLPAISIPAGFTAGPPRLPVGLQLIGPRLAEPALLRVAAAHEAASSWQLERPPAIGRASS
jgi:aspartyl-tRNA(Asn)/glutamyl-tRNA(Gln) amidotransferase subunit A